jgi:hypothetical protein
MDRRASLRVLSTALHLAPKLFEAVIWATIADDSSDEVEGKGRMNTIPTAVDEQTLGVL